MNWYAIFTQEAQALCERHLARDFDYQLPHTIDYNAYVTLFLTGERVSEATRSLRSPVQFRGGLR